MQFRYAKTDNVFPWHLLEGEPPPSILHREGKSQLTGHRHKCPPRPVSGSRDLTSLFTPLVAGVLWKCPVPIPKLLLYYSMMEIMVVSEILYLKREKKLGSIAQDVHDLSWHGGYSNSKHLETNWCLPLSLSPFPFRSVQVTPIILATQNLFLFFIPLQQ